MLVLEMGLSQKEVNLVSSQPQTNKKICTIASKLWLAHQEIVVYIHVCPNSE